ncbi:uncharacterized protein DNG_09857 [Cephalotrichum gorgonifer]|uniref:CMP/dCMP-type deaminase domain-containing protein n=1 Tax=Cephalotrichum gorgonifer TaxID=2041049 RepID=A0AAE8N8A4_9PEZI|nr:uncharacterized protein DNG_09857 [Cephalotrichum gorgonifer]
MPSTRVYLTTLVATGAISSQAHGNEANLIAETVLNEPALAINGIPFSTRAYWMRTANDALFEVLQDPCPFAAFGTVIVNHTAGGLGKAVCIGANSSGRSGNPTQHDPNGPYNLTTSEALGAFSELSLYTNAESCPMCASAIRWAGFKEYIYGTSINTLIGKGWGQIRIPSMEVIRQSFDLGPTPRLIAEVLTNETEPYFLWHTETI